MRVALTGASGFIGASVARALAEGGHTVTAMVRPTSVREHVAPYVDRFVVGDQADPAIWADLVEKADAMVHNSVDWAALREGALRRHLESNLLGSIELLDHCRRAGVGRFVFVSSVATHHDISPKWEGIVDEDHPLRPATLYGACKAAVEPHLWWAHYSEGMHTAAVRPAGVYGVEPVRLEKSHGYGQVKRLQEGKRVTPAEFPGGGKWVHVEDVALAIVRAIEREEASGRAFNLADCYAKRTRFAEHAVEILGLDEAMVEPDTGPPARNMFSKEATRGVLGVGLDRGDDGLREHMRALIEAIHERET